MIRGGGSKWLAGDKALIPSLFIKTSQIFLVKVDNNLVKTSNIVMMYSKLLASNFCPISHPTSMLPRSDILLLVNIRLKYFYQWRISQPARKGNQFIKKNTYLNKFGFNIMKKGNKGVFFAPALQTLLIKHSQNYCHKIKKIALVKFMERTTLRHHFKPNLEVSVLQRTNPSSPFVIGSSAATAEFFKNSIQNFIHKSSRLHLLYFIIQ